VSEVLEIDVPETEDVEIIADVNDYADEGTALGCGDDNPYQ
jgi:hypothetical protein